MPFAEYRYRIISFRTSLVIAAWLFFQSFSVLARAEDNPSTNRAEVPFRLESGFLVVIDGRIGNLHGLKFILDTGTTRSVVDRKVAEKLRVRRYPGRMFDFNRFVATERAIFPGIEFGAVQIANPMMLIGDLANLSSLASQADVLIGSDLLSSKNLTIDYEAKRVLFSTPEPAAFHPLNYDSAYMIVEMEVQNHPIRLLVDTGLQEILLPFPESKYLTV